MWNLAHLILNILSPAQALSWFPEILTAHISPLNEAFYKSFPWFSTREQTVLESETHQARASLSIFNPLPFQTEGFKMLTTYCDCNHTTSTIPAIKPLKENSRTSHCVEICHYLNIWNNMSIIIAIWAGSITHTWQVLWTIYIPTPLP